MTRLVAIIAALLLGTAYAAAAPDVSGEWVVADKTARIGIKPCPDGLCGSIVWEQTPGGLDEKNPDPAKRARPLLGMEFIHMKQTGPNKWQGSVYNAENGKTYDAKMSLESPDVLRMEGCVLGGLICGGESWARHKDAATTTAAKGKADPATTSATPAKTAKSAPRS